MTFLLKSTKNSSPFLCQKDKIKTDSLFDSGSHPKKVLITPFQQSLIYGTLLGDSYLTFRGNVEIRQTLHHEEYILWLFHQLKSLTTGNPPRLVTQLDKRTLREYKSLRFYTRNIFREWRSVFYDENRKKILPENFRESLDAEALAIWFLDDGGRCSNMSHGVFLTVDSFTHDDIIRIQETLRTQFDIHTRLYTVGKSKKGLIQKRLVISGKNYLKFRDLVYPIVKQFPSMLKKKL